MLGFYFCHGIFLRLMNFDCPLLLPPLYLIFCKYFWTQIELNGNMIFFELVNNCLQYSNTCYKSFKKICKIHFVHKISIKIFHKLKKHWLSKCPYGAEILYRLGYCTYKIQFVTDTNFCNMTIVRISTAVTTNCYTNLWVVCYWEI